MSLSLSTLSLFKRGIALMFAFVFILLGSSKLPEKSKSLSL